MGKTKAPERVILRAQFFDDQGVGQGGQLCQMKNARGFNGFGQVASAGWLPARWLPQTGFPGFRKRIQHAKIVIPQAFDNESLFPRSRTKWLPPGFPGEKASRYRNAALRPPRIQTGPGRNHARGVQTKALASHGGRPGKEVLSPVAHPVDSSNIAGQGIADAEEFHPVARSR